MRERVNARQAISGHAVSVSCDAVWLRLLLCLLPNLPIVILLAWHRVLITALAFSPGPWEEHSIPSTDRAYWLLCQRPYYINPLIGQAEVLFSLSRAVCEAKRWRLNYSWFRPARLELTALLMATLHMAFHSWLINTFKTQLVHTRWRPVTLF